MQKTKVTTSSQQFDAFRDDWWNPTGRLFSLHRINPLRVSYFESVAGDFKGRRVLDVGCGGGLLSEEFAKRGAAVTGIDLSPMAIEAAVRHAKASSLSIDYRVTSPQKFLASNPDERFDIIACAEVLEHVDDLAGFLKDTLTMLKPGGIFLFGTINKTLKARLLAVVVAENILGMIPKGTHDHRRFIRPSELKRLLEENNVTMKGLKGMSYDPLKMEFKLSSDTSVNYLGWAVKEAGDQPA